LNLDCVFQAFPHLETERLVLRRLHLTDAESLFAILANEEVTRFYDDVAFTEISQAREQIKAWASGFDGRRCI
jgi:ribosomal-protein-alanine N-acetyltransferase